MKIVLLAGGTGSSKLIRGLSSFTEDFTVIANVGDNIWLHGLYICPDLDIAMYALAGILDRSKSWGVAGDSFAVLGQLAKLGEENWFNLGDRDLATHILRTELLKQGLSLTQATRKLSMKLGVRQRLLPPTDDHVETHILTSSGELHLQEFWVRDGGREEVAGVRYHGMEEARATPEALSSLASADRIIFCPANPVSSIMPILSTPGIREALVKSKAVKVALSPFQGDQPFSGPAAKFMRSLKMEATSLSLARLYLGAVDRFVIDRRDELMKGEIEEIGVRCSVTETAMTDPGSETRIARLLVEV